MEHFDDMLMRHTTQDKDHLIWEGFMLRGRYPVYCYRGERGESATVRVARYLYARKFGDFRGNLKLKCDILRCVEPLHHYGPATPQVHKRNRKDKAIRTQRAALIRKLAGEGFKRQDIARNLGLDYGTVSRIISRAKLD